MCKINFFNADRKLADRLTSFINDKKIDCGSIQYYYDYHIQQLRNCIASQENLRGSLVSDDTINKTIAQYESQIEDLKDEKSKKLEETRTWEWDDNDKKLEKLSKKKDVTELELACGITAWFRHYGLQTDDMEYVYNLVHTCFGIREKSDKKFVKDLASGKNADATQRRTDSLKAFYAQVATDAMVAGTVKTKNLSEIVRETYEKELAEKKAKKASKNK